MAYFVCLNYYILLLFLTFFLEFLKHGQLSALSENIIRYDFLWVVLVRFVSHESRSAMIYFIHSAHYLLECIVKYN